jgi:hypothetical protein
LEATTADFVSYMSKVDTDIQTAMEDADAALAAWGKSASELPTVLEQIASQEAARGVSGETLLKTMGENAKALQGLGLSFEESVDYLAQLEENGEDSAAVVTDLQALVNKLVEQGQTQTEALESVRDSLQNASGASSYTAPVAEEEAVPEGWWNKLLSAVQGVKQFTSDNADELSAIKSGISDLAGLMSDVSDLIDTGSTLVSAIGSTENSADLWSVLTGGEVTSKIGSWISGLVDLGSKIATIIAVVPKVISFVSKIASLIGFADGGIVTSPTIFGMSGNSPLLAGEAGPEAILPLSSFYGELERILGSSRGGGVTVAVNIERFENNTDSDIDDLAQRVSRVIAQEIDNGGVLA